MLAINQEELFKNIEILPLDLKTKLVDMLLKSINPQDGAVDNLWITEANRRKKEIDEGFVETISGKDVFKKIQQKFENR